MNAQEILVAIMTMTIKYLFKNSLLNVPPISYLQEGKVYYFKEHFLYALELISFDLYNDMPRGLGKNSISV